MTASINLWVAVLVSSVSVLDMLRTLSEAFLASSRDTLEHRHRINWQHSLLEIRPQRHLLAKNLIASSRPDRPRQWSLIALKASSHNASCAASLDRLARSVGDLLAIVGGRASAA